jgi:aminomethyltransferase
LQAGLEWVVGWEKGEFRGRQALERERRNGVIRRLRGLITADRQPPREGAIVLAEDRRVGTVTSGNFSPVLGRGIAMAFIDTSVEVAAGSPVELEVRGRRLEASVTSLPFVRGHRARPAPQPQGS